MMRCRKVSPRLLCGTAAVIAALICSVVGCGGGGPRIVKVSGTVLLDGKPLNLPPGVQAFVQFVPPGAKPASGSIDPQTGRFSLTTYKPDDGCVVGDHKVAVIIRAMAGNESFSLIDEKYEKPETSGITVKIDGPTDKLEINLSGPLRPLPPGFKVEVSQDPNIM
jgi:hypothetical protein